MFTNTIRKLQSTKRVLTRIVAAALVAITLMLAPLQGYATTYNNYGSAGSVQVPATQGWDNLDYSSSLSFPSRYAWRSPANYGDQWVKATYYIFKYDIYTRSWLFYKSDFTANVIFAGEPGKWMSGLTFPVAPGGGKFYTIVDVEWRNTNFAWLGTNRVYYTGPDYQCLNYRINTCRINYGYIELF